MDGESSNSSELTDQSSSPPVAGAEPQQEGKVTGQKRPREKKEKERQGFKTKEDKETGIITRECDDWKRVKYEIPNKRIDECDFRLREVYGVVGMQKGAGKSTFMSHIVKRLWEEHANNKISDVFLFCPRGSQKAPWKWMLEEEYGLGPTRIVEKNFIPALKALLAQQKKSKLSEDEGHVLVVIDDSANEIDFTSAEVQDVMLSFATQVRQPDVNVTMFVAIQAVTLLPTKLRLNVHYWCIGKTGTQQLKHITSSQSFVNADTVEEAVVKRCHNYQFLVLDTEGSEAYVTKAPQQ